MIAHDRRLGVRVPLEMFMNQYVDDRPFRAMVVNISETGLYVHKVITPILRPRKVVGLEIELPGTSDTIWARGEVCHDSIDDYFHGQGIRFTGIPRAHARLLRDYCIEQRRAQLADLLDRIRQARMH